MTYSKTIELIKHQRNLMRNVADFDSSLSILVNLGTVGDNIDLLSNSKGESISQEKIMRQIYANDLFSI